MSHFKYKQELPPDGGYKPIIWHRNPAKTLFRGWQMFAIWGASISCYLYIHKTRQVPFIKREDLEKLESRIALEPLMFAEIDRMKLIEIRRNREEERELMKNVPGWTVGGLFGEKIYRTLGEDEWPLIQSKEFFAHRRYANEWYIHVFELWET